MKAAVYDHYGPPEVLRIADVPPPEPEADEVLVRVRASTVNRTDCHMRGAYPVVWRFMLGLRRPKRRVLGSEFAGEVVKFGSDVTDFAVGDRVFGMGRSAHAELIRVREQGLIAHMPEGMSFEEAAAVCDGAYQGFTALRGAKVGSGTRLLVYGASGSCGTAAVQLGKYLGAHVTAVCNTKNVEVVRSLGADEVVDYLREDYRRRGETYDVILDAVAKHSFLRARRALKPRGLFVATDGPLVNFPLAFLTRWSRKQVRFFYERPRREDVLLLKQLLETGRYRAVIDRTYPLEDVVEAHRYVETLQKTGNVVLTVR